MRFQKLKWEEMTIEEKVSNLKNRIWKFFQNIHILKKSKTKEYTLTSIQKTPRDARILMSTRGLIFIAGIIVGFFVGM